MCPYSGASILAKSVTFRAFQQPTEISAAETASGFELLGNGNVVSKLRADPSQEKTEDYEAEQVGNQMLSGRVLECPL